MRTIKIFILFIFFSQFTFGQNVCEDFKNFEESQKWIKELEQLDPKARKSKIFDRIDCEHASEQEEVDFSLTVIIAGGSTSNVNYFSKEQIETLKLFPSENIEIWASLCESEGVYPQKCNLGFVVFKRPDKPVLNEIPELQNVRLKRRRGKIIITLESEIDSNIQFEVNNLLKNHGPRLLAKTKLKKGKNRFVFRRSGSLQIIELELNNKKLIIII